MTDDPGAAKMRTCFIAMPITTHERDVELYGDVDHWTHVMEQLFVPAIEAAGFEPIVPIASGSSMIHGDIVRHLQTADMVLCDLSGHNPNVLFELGVRTSLNLPVALVRDEHTQLPFDVGGINTHSYKSSLHAWEIAAEVLHLTDHVMEASTSCNGTNPLWQFFGLTITATETQSGDDPDNAMLQLIYDDIRSLKGRVESIARRSTVPPAEERLRARRAATLLQRILDLGASRVISTPYGFRIVTEGDPAKFSEELITHADRRLRDHGFEITSIAKRNEQLTIRAERLDDSEDITGHFTSWKMMQRPTNPDTGD